MKLSIKESNDNSYSARDVDIMDLVHELDPEDWDHHMSDLYLRKTPETTRIISQLRPDLRTNVTTFRDQIDDDLWYEIPFMYHN